MTTWRPLRTSLAPLCVLSLFAACTDSNVGITPPEAPAAASAAVDWSRAFMDNQFAGQVESRWDTPWRKLSDQELTEAVAQAGGHVFIGFKEPTARGGVDEKGRVLVSTESAQRAKEQLRALGISFVDEYKLIPTVTAVIPADLTAKLRANPLIEYVEPIFPGKRLAEDTTWNIRRVRAPEAWASSNGSGVRVLIIDSGSPAGHPDHNIPVAAGCVSGLGSADIDGHGTFVAGVVGALNNAAYVIGAAHGAALWTAKDGDYLPMPNGTVCGVEYGRYNNTFAMNISSSMSPYTPLTDQITAAYYQNGFLVIAAAGNTGGSVTYPAKLPEVIAVTATDFNNGKPIWASFGTEAELAAPGVNVPSTSLLSGSCSSGGYVSYCDGSSFSAPLVAAAAAIVKSYYPSWTNVQVRQRLQSTATDIGAPGRDIYFGYGLLNIGAAVGQ